MNNPVKDPDCNPRGCFASSRRQKISTLALLLAGALGGTAQAQLLHRYDFNSVNDTVGTANGTLEGSASLSSGALYSGGGFINGTLSGGVPSNGFMLPATAVAGITNAFTIDCWFLANYGGGYSTLFSFSDGTTGNYVLATPARGNYPYASGVAVIGGGGNGSEQQALGQYHDDGALHEMVITYDGTTLSYYLDGGLATFPGQSVSPTLTDAGVNLSTMTDIGIAGGSPWGDNSINGYSYDFRLYGQALTSAQVAAVYALGKDASNSSIITAIAPPTAFVWNGGGANNNWSTALNWLSGIAPAASGTSLTFAGSTRTSPNLDASFGVTGLVFSNTASSFAIGTANGSSLTLSGNVVNNSTSSQTLNVPVTFAVAGSLNAAAGGLVINSNLTLGASALTLSGTGNISLKGNVTGSGNVTMNGSGTLTLAGASVTSGVISFNNGTANVTSTVNAANGTTYVGYTSGNGILNLSGNTFNDAGEIRVSGSDINGTAPNGTGILNLTNSTLNVGALTLARGNNNQNSVAGTVNLNSGSTLTSSNDVILGFAGTGLGKLAINGGTFIIGPTATKWFQVGFYDATAGEVDITNGNLFLDNGTSIKMCRGGTTGANVINQAGGAVTFYSDAGVTVGGGGNLDMNYAGGASSSDTYNLNGGTLTVPQIVASASSGSSTFNFNGGTLKPTASSTTFMQGLTAANVQAGGAIIDTAGNSISIGQALTDAGGGLTKLGNGTLTLTGGYNYSGATRVLGGVLALSTTYGTPGTPGDLVVSNATLNLDASSGTGLPVGNLITATGGIINISATPTASGIIGTGGLTLGNNSTVSLAYGTLSANPSVAAINGAGSLTKGTNVVINVAATGLGVGLFPVITVGSGTVTTNGFVVGSLPAGVKAVLTNSTSTELDLLVTSAGQLLNWHGADASSNPLPNWDINTSANWYDLNSNPAKYLQYSGNTVGDNVVFGNNGYNTDGTNHVNLAGTVVPATVMFSSSSPYTVTGAGSIGGATFVMLTNDSSSVYFGTANSYTGGTVIGSGTLIITNNNALGATSGGVTFAGGALEANNSLSSSRAITVTANSQIGVAAGATVSLSSAISGSGSLTKSDVGTLTLTGNSSNTGSTLVGAGTLNLTGSLTNTSVTVGSGSADAVLNLAGNISSGNLFVGNASGAVGAVYQTGGNLNLANGTGDLLNLGNTDSSYGYYSAAAGNLNINGIAIGGENNPNVWPPSGTAANGLMEINGATINNIGWITLSRGGSQNIGVLNMFSGSLTYAGGGISCNWELSGSDQTSIINVQGGSITSTSQGVYFRTVNTGILNLNGGLVSGTTVNGPGIVNFNGGVLQASAGNGDYLAVTRANVYANGATIDDGGNNITINQPLVAADGYGVSSISLSAGGSGYIAPPVVIVSGGTGSNATAIATMAGGVVTGITVTSPGTGYAAADTLAVTFTGGGNSAVAPTVNTVSLTPNTSGGLTKIGTGTVYLNGVNTYPGPTKVTAGTLMGTGTLAGNLTNNATLTPGNAFGGTLTVNGNITLAAGSTNSFLVNNTTSTNSAVVAGGNVTYGGVLNIVPVGSFTAGQQFQLFSGAGATNTGKFASITGSAGSGLGFTFTNGVLSVVATMATNPTNITYSVTGNTLSLTWPADHLGWILQAQTNSLSTGITTNWVDVAGSGNSTSATITINPATPTAFYRLRTP